MIVGIQGSRSFNDYNIFLRGMGVALRALPEDDKEITILSAGAGQVNEFGLEFSNINERGLKARGIKIRFRKVPPKWLEDNVHTLGYFLYFSKPKETLPSIVDKADAKDIEVGIYRY